MSERIRLTHQRQRLTRTAGRPAGGLYGYAKSIQASCESAVRKLRKASLSLITKAYRQDANVVPFLEAHAKRNKSAPARVLLAALKDSQPFYRKHGIEGGKTASVGRYGLYGFRANTARLGLSACSRLREEAGHIASDLHVRKAALHDRITGFFSEHAKTAKCGYSRLLVMGYPDVAMKLASTPPEGVEAWLAWEED